MWYVRPAKGRPACAYAQSDQSLASNFNILLLLSYWPHIIWTLYAKKQATQARLSLYLSKYHIFGNLMSWPTQTLNLPVVLILHLVPEVLSLQELHVVLVVHFHRDTHDHPKNQMYMLPFSCFVFETVN